MKLNLIWRFLNAKKPFFSRDYLYILSVDGRGEDASEIELASPRSTSYGLSKERQIGAGTEIFMFVYT